MSETESSVPRAVQDTGRRAVGEDLVQLLGSRTAVEREGLPQNYRMRADAHYVDQLESSASPVVRVVATRQIDAPEIPPSARLDALTKSITTYGVLQPLIVRRQSGRYALIAGRSRLAAAVAAGLTAVPCVLHDVEGAVAAALAQADNLRMNESPEAPRPDRDPVVGAVLQALMADLSTIAGAVALLKPAAGALPTQVAADLIQAQAWRAAWLVSSIRGTLESSRPESVTAVFQRVVSGFRPHARLTGLHLEPSIAAGAAAFTVDEDLAVMTLTGCVFATLSWLEGAAQSRIEVRADVPQPRTLKVEVIQREVGIPPNLGRHLLDDGLDRPADVIATLALRTAKAVAAFHGGTMQLASIPGRGSVLQITFVKPHGAA